MADRADLVDSGEAEHLVVQARSLCNVLGVIRRKLTALRQRGACTDDVVHFQSMLDEIDERWRGEDGFATAVAATNPELQAKCSTLFNVCYDLLEELRPLAVDMAPSIKATFQRLLDLRSQLAALRGAPHTFASVQPLQAELDAIDAEASNPHFGGDGASPERVVPPGQAVCAELLESCYGLICQLAESAQDLGPEMQHLASQLAGVRGALVQLNHEGAHTEQDILHHQALLDIIATKRVGGVWGGSPLTSDAGSGPGAAVAAAVPSGHVVVAALWEQCSQLLAAMRATATEMSPQVEPTWQELHSLWEELEALRRRQHTLEEVQALQARLEAVDAARVDGVFGGMPDAADAAAPPPAGQAACSSLLHKSYRSVDLLYRQLRGRHLHMLPAVQLE